MRGVAATILSAIVLAVTACATSPPEYSSSPFERAVEPHSSEGRYADAVRNVRPLAEQGDALAEGFLGERYYRGEGVSKDSMEAKKWLQRAANQGEPTSIYRFGLYEKYGWSLNAEAIAEILSELAEDGDDMAQMILGSLYAYGRGVTQSYREAVKWWRLSANQYNGYAMSNLGAAHVKGHGALQGNVMAHMWLNLASSHLSWPDARTIAVNENGGAIIPH